MDYLVTEVRVLDGFHQICGPALTNKVAYRYFEFLKRLDNMKHVQVAFDVFLTFNE